MHRRHAPQPLPITAGQIDQPVVGHLWFPSGVFGYLPEAELLLSTIDCFFVPRNLHRTSCGRQQDDTQASRENDFLDRKANSASAASISGSRGKLPRPLSTHSGVRSDRAAEAATARTRRCATCPGRAVTDTRPLVEAFPQLRGGQGNVRPSFFLPVLARPLAAVAAEAARGPASAGLVPPADGCGRVPSPRAGTLVLTSLITRPGRVAGGRGTFLREPSAHVVARTQPAAWADGLRAG